MHASQWPPIEGYCEEAVGEFGAIVATYLAHGVDPMEVCIVVGACDGGSSKAAGPQPAGGRPGEPARGAPGRLGGALSDLRRMWATVRARQHGSA